MTGRLILLFLLIGQAVVFSQAPVSKTYRTPPRSIPLGIYNFEPHHFYVTRYNRLAHDITIERRRKKDGSVAAFTALKLDSVNAVWFNYENLDQEFFQKDGQLYFVFSRVLNNKCELYMKKIDTVGKSSGFIPILSFAGEKNEDYLDLSFRLTDQKELLVCRTRATGTNVYRQVDLFDPSTRKILHSTKLPPENPVTGYSTNYLFDTNGDLWYLLLHHHYEWEIMFGDAPGLSYSALLNSSVGMDSIELATFDRSGTNFRKSGIVAKGLTTLHAAVPSLTGKGYHLQLMYSGVDLLGKEQIRFSVHTYDRSLTHSEISDQPLTESLSERLTFFDGTDFDEASRKNYRLESSLNTESCKYYFSERVQQNYYKELVVWGADSAGKLTMQALIPRKILYFSDRTRYRSLGKVMHASYGGMAYSFLLENRGNEVIPAEEFSFHEFRRQETVAGANMVAYVLQNGTCNKKVAYRNGDFSCVPLTYVGTMPDIVLYLVKNDVEKFVIMNLNEL